MTIDIDSQITCVAREITMRNRMYPQWVARGTMTDGKAKAELTAMTAVLHTLKDIKKRADERQGSLLDQSIG